MPSHLHPLSPSACDAIGRTPLVALDRITAEYSGRIFAKLEMLNPGFSKKDRAARQIIEDAEADGSLRPGQTVVELTSGNMGTGLAIVCATKGYPFVAVMSRGNSEERARMMSALGAEVVLVDQHPESHVGHVTGADLERVEEEAQRLTEARHAFRADQFNRAGNAKAHYLGTGPEIWQQSDGRIDGFCDFVGSGGTYAGVTRFLKEQNPNIKCYVVEPEQAAILAGKRVSRPAHPIQGGGYAMDALELMKRSAGRRLPRSIWRSRDPRGTPARQEGRNLRRLLLRREPGSRPPAPRRSAQRWHHRRRRLRFGTEVLQHRPLGSQLRVPNAK